MWVVGGAATRLHRSQRQLVDSAWGMGLTSCEAGSAMATWMHTLAQSGLRGHTAWGNMLSLVPAVHSCEAMFLKKIRFDPGFIRKSTKDPGHATACA